MPHGTAFPRKEGPWIIHDEQTVYDNPWLQLQTYNVTVPDGSAGIYAVMRPKSLAVGILPLDEQGNTWLVGQHRFPLNLYSWELPEGGGDKSVDPKISAARELEEEVGLKAAQFHEIGTWYTSNSLTDEKAIGFIATDLEPGKVAPDPSEVLEIRQVRFADLLKDVISGKIHDAFTVLMVTTAYIKAQQKTLPDHLTELILKG